MTHAVSWYLLFFLLMAPTVPQRADLEKSVTRYWDALQKGDKASALELVVSESRNDFIRRQDPPIRSWRLLSVEAEGPDQALVSVRVSRMIRGMTGFFDQTVAETWVFDGKDWKVRLAHLGAKSVKRLFSPSPSASTVPLEEGLRILPKEVHISFLNPSQKGPIVIRNGTKDTVRVEKVAVDQKKFQRLDSISEVPPQGQALIEIKYTGSELAKDLKSSVEVVLRQGEKEESYTIPILYNYLSPATRALFGLTPEQAEKLKHGDRLVPAIKPPPVSSSQRKAPKDSDGGQGSKPASPPPAS